MSNPDSSITQYPETLILEAGESVEGRFKRLERGHTKKGEARPIAILEVESKDRCLWLNETALRRKVQELRPEPGELLSITKGAEKIESATTGNAYWPFVVKVAGRTAETLSWDDPLLGGAEDAPPQGAALDQGAPSDPEEEVGKDDIPF